MGVGVTEIVLKDNKHLRKGLGWNFSKLTLKVTLYHVKLTAIH